MVLYVKIKKPWIEAEVSCKTRWSSQDVILVINISVKQLKTVHSSQPDRIPESSTSTLYKPTDIAVYDKCRLQTGKL